MKPVIMLRLSRVAFGKPAVRVSVPVYHFSALPVAPQPLQCFTRTFVYHPERLESIETKEINTRLHYLSKRCLINKVL